MSNKVYWSVPCLRHVENSDDRLINALIKLFKKPPFLLNTEDIPYIEGIAACGIPGAHELIDVIYKNKSIQIDFSYDCSMAE